MFEIFEKKLLVFWAAKFEFWRLWLSSCSCEKTCF